MRAVIGACSVAWAAMPEQPPMPGGSHAPDWARAPRLRAVRRARAASAKVGLLARLRGWHDVVVEHPFGKPDQFFAPAPAAQLEKTFHQPKRIYGDLVGLEVCGIRRHRHDIH